MSNMLDEIREQPDVLERTLKAERGPVEELRKILKHDPPRLVMLAARGTSDNAAQFGRYLLQVTTGLPVALAAPSIFTLYDSPFRFDDVLVVAISQSGESTDTNTVVERAREQGARTIGFTTEGSSALSKIAQHLFLVHSGRERSIAATKTYTGQLLLTYMLAYALGADMALDDLARLPEWAARALTLELDMARRAERYRFMEHAVVLGRGLNYASAFEFALKLMETCYVVAERFSSADLLHGPIAMMEAGFPAFLFAPSGVTWPGTRDMVKTLNELKAETMIITDVSNVEAARDRRSAIVPVALDEIFTPIPYIIPAQLFAASLAEEKGVNPDQPRALSKVTRTL